MSQQDEEWKTCRETIDRFDGILVDLRKYGFSILTGLITAGSFLGFTTTPQNVQIGVIIVTMVLVVVLYYLDIYYQSLFFGAMFRARFLEVFKLNRALTFYISGFYGAAGTGKILHLLYYGFLGGLVILGLVVAFDAQSKATMSALNTTKPAAASLSTSNENSLRVTMGAKVSLMSANKTSSNECVLPTDLSSLTSCPIFGVSVIILSGSAILALVSMLYLGVISDGRRTKAVKTLSRLLESYRKYKDDPQKVDELEGHIAKYFQRYI